MYLRATNDIVYTLDTRTTKPKVYMKYKCT